MKIDNLYESLLNTISVIDVNNTSDFPSYISNYFNNPSYFINNKNIKIDVVNMKPSEYIRIAKTLLSKTWGRTTLSRTSTSSGRDKIEFYAEKMKSGVKFPLPYLNYIDNTQQGMHRAEAALLAGAKTIQVAIIKNARVIKDED